MDEHHFLRRRQLLARAGGGLGALALGSLLHEERAAAEAGADSLAPKKPPLPARAKAVIWLFMNGGPSQVDTWDYKPELAKRDGQELPGFDKNTGFFAKQVGPLMASPFKFARHGQSGKWVSELFPHMATHVDKMAFVHSCFTGSNNHSPALFMLNTGVARMGLPCVGSWVTYGLGSESRDLPAFIVMSDPLGRGLPKGHAQNWGAGVLPGVYQGTLLRAKGAPIENLERPPGMTAERQRRQLDLLGALGRARPSPSVAHQSDQALGARIQSFELAYRMQAAGPEAIAIDKEPASIQALYGVDDPACAHFARQCLLARRMVERGVRFVQIYSGGMENQLSWDGHSDIRGNHGGFARETDKPIAGLLADLEQRGLLSQTLIIWGGEFGRLPLSQKSAKPGRDHNPHAFTVWFAGGGVRAGTSHGETDEIGHKAVTDRVSVHDLHATILHLLGLSHEKLTFRYNGLDVKLTGVEGGKVLPLAG